MSFTILACGGKNVFETRGCALLRKFGILDRAEMHGRRRNVIINVGGVQQSLLYMDGTRAPDSAVCATEIVFNVPIIYHVTFLLAFVATEMMKISVWLQTFTELEHLVVDSRIRRLRRSIERLNSLTWIHLEANLSSRAKALCEIPSGSLISLTWC